MNPHPESLCDLLVCLALISEAVNCLHTDPQFNFPSYFSLILSDCYYDDDHYYY